MAVVAILLVVGTILLLLETILPGLIAGIAGFGCLVAGVVMGYYEFGPNTGALIMLGVMLGLVIGCALWVKYFPESRMAQVFISRRVVGEIKAEKPELLHQVGTACTQLRPSGTAIINGKRVDVVSEGALIPRGTPVKVVAIEGLRVVVRAMAEERQSDPKLKTLNT